MNNEFRYSMVTTVFNDREEVINLIKEMENQTLKPVEFIIVDGGSKDGTPQRIREYAEQSSLNIMVVEGGRLNIAQGFNLGIKSAVCDYIGIVACGNHYPADFFERLANDLKENENAYSAYSAIAGRGSTRFARAYTRLYIGENSVYIEMFPTNHGNLTKKEVFVRENYFYEKFQYAGEDREFFLRLAEKKYKFISDDELIVKWDVPGSINEYVRQQRGYVISDMEMYDNKVVFHIYWSKLRYVFLFFLMIILLLIPVTRYAGFVPLIYFIYRNLNKLIKYGMDYVGLYNLSHFVPVYAMLKNMRFLKRKNKIDRVLHSYV